MSPGKTIEEVLRRGKHKNPASKGLRVKQQGPERVFMGTRACPTWVPRTPLPLPAPHCGTKLFSSKEFQPKAGEDQSMLSLGKEGTQTAPSPHRGSLLRGQKGSAPLLPLAGGQSVGSPPTHPPRTRHQTPNPALQGETLTPRFEKIPKSNESPATRRTENLLKYSFHTQHSAHLPPAPAQPPAWCSQPQNVGRRGSFPHCPQLKPSRNLNKNKFKSDFLKHLKGY